MIKTLLLVLLLMPALAEAACTLPASTASFGTASSFTVNTTASTSSSSVNVNCGSGTTLALLSNNTITLQLASATVVTNTRGVMKRSGDTGTDNIPLQLCSDSACASEMRVGGTIYTYNQAQLLNLIGLLGGLNFTIPLYLRTVPGQVIAAGTYTVTLNVAVTYNICTSISLAGLCLTLQNGSGVIPMTTTMIVTNDCSTITSPNVSFGSAPLVSSFSSVSQAITIICTKGSVYTVGMSNGNYAVGSVRNMASSSNRLSYEIYKGTTSSRWGPASTERWASADSTAVSSDGLTRSYNYVARVLTTQSTPPAGNYSDSVVVDITF